MHMTWLDWAVVAAVMTLFVAMAVAANRLSKSVADFLVAGRSAGRYMLTVAYGAEWLGAINIVAMFEAYYIGGFPCMWWVMLSTPFIVYMRVSGWGVYRFRETRSMTIAQILETRYDRRVRMAAGIISWSAGMINFSFFPLVSSRLIMSIIGLPEQFHAAGIVFSTSTVVAAAMIAVPLCFILVGGHTSVMVSNFMQGLFTNVAAVIIVGVLLCTVFDWNTITHVLITTAKPGASMFDPLHTSNTKDFTASFFIINIVVAWYGAMSDVPSQAFFGSGKSAHEQRMGYLLSQISWQGLLVFFMVVAMCAMTMMQAPAYASVAATVNQSLAAVPAEYQGKVLVSSTLPHMLPPGLVGLFCAIMLAALLSSHNSFMHAWGGVLLQDIILPLRKTPLETRAHLWALRGAILFVGIVAFLLSTSFNPQQSILMLFASVNSIWLGPAGAVMLGGLYWKKGTAQAAIVTLLAGCAVGLALFGVQQAWPYWHDKAEFPLNGQYCLLINIIFSTLLYTAVSFVTSAGEFNMDRMLHRGRYAIAGEELPMLRPSKWWQTIFGITPMFKRRDRVTAYVIVGYFLVWLGVFAAGTIYGALFDPGELAWARFWQVYIYISAGLLVVTTIWLGVGGLRDMANLFRSLRGEDRDYSDTGEAAPGDPATPAATAAQSEVLP
jgi:solute:Na+ symporter, SSS family